MPLFHHQPAGVRQTDKKRFCVARLLRCLLLYRRHLRNTHYGQDCAYAGESILVPAIADIVEIFPEKEAKVLEIYIDNSKFGIRNSETDLIYN